MQQRWLMAWGLAAGAVVLAAGCSSSDRRGGPGDGMDAGVDASMPAEGDPCEQGDLECRGRKVLTCEGGELVEERTCEEGMTCAPGLGCRMCRPGRTFCKDNEVHECGSDGNSSTKQKTCGEREVCRTGVCINACEAAREDRSTVGCDYYAADLDNAWGEGEQMGMTFPNASNEQYAVVLANPSNVSVRAIVSRNDGNPGDSLQERQEKQVQIPPNDLVRIDLPPRHVDGSFDGMNEGPGTYLSSQAYRIRTNFPVVAYQFNPIVQSFSNDASLLIPVTGLDTHYRVMNWPTANPAYPPEQLGDPPPGIPDHAYVTVIGTQENTSVRVKLGGDITGGSIQGGGDIPAKSEGEVVQATLGPYDVLNLETEEQQASLDNPGALSPADMTGTVVEATKPVAVFSGNERGIAPLGNDVSAHPDGEPDDLCCTEHMEEQVFPTTSWGKQFVVTRSPVRSSHESWREPDLYRVMADKDGTEVTTNLDGGSSSFSLSAGEWKDFSTQKPFILEANKAISIQQVQVSQSWVREWKQGHGGDPSMLQFPPYEQFRKDYVFLVPGTFTTDYVVLAAPVGTVVKLDGGDIDGDEFTSICTEEQVGEVDGTMYKAVTCPVEDGTHRLESSKPVGLMVYGYHSVGSYGYAGGANLEKINPLI